MHIFRKLDIVYRFVCKDNAIKAENLLKQNFFSGKKSMLPQTKTGLCIFAK
ncbi:unknown [Prevotella sp. CAG:617]|nr:unknown [Prevotella sp. CAG:617]